MARQGGIVVENNLTGGLVTEATGLNFPENACTETYNCEFDPVGRVNRRKGFKFETGFSLKTVNKTGAAISQFLWKNVGGNGDRNFLVVQIGVVLLFYSVDKNATLSSGARADFIDLSAYQVPGSPPFIGVECSFSNGLGYLFVTHPYLEPFYIKYNEVTNVFSVQTINLRVRDFEGVEDGLPTDTRVFSLDSQHKYNLYNQGWSAPAKGFYGGSDIALTLWSNDGFTTRGDYPSNADVWWFYRGPYDLGSGVPISQNPAFFRNILVDTLAIGNSPAPKGHYLLNLHYQDRSAVSGVPGLPATNTGYFRVATNAFYSGRVFYSGLAQSGYVGKVYFSQIIERDSQFGECYQSNDPTSEDNSDLLPSDGGVISIAEAGKILRMIPVGNSLIVFAVNGIWSIMGSEGLGFRANDYSVRKISSNSIISATNFIDYNGTPMWWATDGIYTIQTDNAVGSASVANVTDKSIKTFFGDIPPESKKYARGIWNPYTNTIEWVYRSIAPVTVEQRYEYDRILVLNTLSGAFYPWTISSTDTVKVAGVVLVDGQSSELGTEAVTDNAFEVVTDDLGITVTVSGRAVSAVAPITKYLVGLGPATSFSLTFAEISDPSYIDWKGTADQDYLSYFVTGYKVHGEGLRKFQPTIFKVFSKNETDTEFLIYGQWDYANNGDNGRWSMVQRIENPAEGYDYDGRKVKVRGHGTALQIRISSVTGMNFDIIGFATYETGNASP